jgi:hypothetical protein
MPACRVNGVRGCPRTPTRTKEETMRANSDIQTKPGDVVVVHGHTTGDPGRTGVILEVLEAASDHEHYRVRWDEEHESLYWPGSDATVRPATRRKLSAAQA